MRRKSIALITIAFTLLAVLWLQLSHSAAMQAAPLQQGEMPGQAETPADSSSPR